MSFRVRLTLYFLLIVALPMVVVGFLVTNVAGDSASGKTDAALGEDLEVALRVYDRDLAEALRTGKDLAHDEQLQSLLAEGRLQEAGAVLDDLSRRRGVAGYELSSSEAGTPPVTAGDSPLFAAATVEIPFGGGRRVTLAISTTTPAEYGDQVAAAAGEDAVVISADGAVEGTIDVGTDQVPAGGEASDLEGSEDLRIASAELPGAGGERVALVAPSESGGFLASRPGIAIAVIAFILVALLAAGLITRTVQGQIAEMLAAARRIGKGDFSGEVPVVGNDELAGLAREFNEMRDRLRTQMDQLRRQQLEIEQSVSRIGEAFASGLDRPALLRILVQTAVDACEAEYGIVALSGHAGAETEAGEPSEAVREVALAAEHRALRETGPVAADRDGAYALASALGRIGDDPLGAMSVARQGREFSPAERDVFLYLVGQAAASVENLVLHELVSEQAVTDELTGLPNNRAFREAIAKEAARAARFKHQLSLLILDIDDFKQVNDTYGHLQGDAVLRMVGGILAEESRGIDEPARYGGEEFVVALPETGAEGAAEVGERIRARIEAEAVPMVDGRGKVSVTASVGLATMPGVAVEVEDLFAAADSALYEAKGAGKNRVVSAEGNGAGRRTDAE